MSLHILETSMSLPLPRKEVFAFFSNAVNLQNITPPELHFRILTPQPIPMQEGTLIDYRLRLFGAPLRWQARILDWEPPVGFIDEQALGLYGYWRHTHRFHDTGEATIIEDVVHYRLPFGPFGALSHPLVRLQLERIFRYRQTAVRALLVGAVDGSCLGDRTGARTRMCGDLKKTRGGIIPRTFLLQPYPLVRAEEMFCFWDHPDQRSKLLIELSRVALLRTVHERSVDKRRTPDPGGE